MSLQSELAKPFYLLKPQIAHQPIRHSNRIVRPSAFLNDYDVMPLSLSTQEASDWGSIRTNPQSISSTPVIKLPRIDEKFTRANHSHTQSMKLVGTSRGSQPMQVVNRHERMHTLGRMRQESPSNLSIDEELQPNPKHRSKRVEFNRLVEVIDFVNGKINSEPLIDTSRMASNKKVISYRRIFNHS